MNNPAHPGEVLREWIPEGMTVTEAAERIGITCVMLSDILNGDARVTPDIAQRLSAWLGTSQEIWIDMQSARDLWQSEVDPENEQAEEIEPGRNADEENSR